MNLEHAEIQTKGRTVRVPAVRLGERTIISEGRWIKMASIFDEPWFTHQNDGPPAEMVARIKQSPLPADIFAFSQDFDDPEVRYPYRHEWDNAAAIPINTHAAWWESLPQESRKNTRRSKREGVVVREVPFDDALVQGIVEIYNSDSVRQTGRFWHYGKGFDVVKKENSSYLERSCFIGAYFNDELIGFIKMVIVGKAARLMQIVAKSQHRDKRPMNQLVSHAVEICEQRGWSHLIYGKYDYGNKSDSSLKEFKARNGFVKMSYPVYYAPLTLKGRLALALRLHRGLLGLLPGWAITRLVTARRWLLQRRAALAGLWSKPRQPAGA